MRSWGGSWLLSFCKENEITFENIDIRVSISLKEDSKVMYGIGGDYEA